MRGIEKIVNQILDEAYEKQTEILDEAHIEVKKIEDAASEEISKLKAAGEKDLSASLSQQEELTRLSIDQNKRRNILLKKQEIIAEILDKSYERLLSLDDEAYFKLLSDMLDKFALNEDGEIYLNQRDLDRMPSSFNEKISSLSKEKSVNLALQQEAKNIDSGFVLVYGGIEENCTFKALMDARREELQDLMQEILF